MIQKFLVAVLFTFISMVSFAQDDINLLRENARKLMIEGDMSTAISTLNKALDTDTSNIAVKKDLALAYYYDKNYKKALALIEPIANGPDGDVSAYQLNGTIYKTMGELKNAEKTYQQALKDFPRSGPLYSEYGELLDITEKPKEAIAIWEKGMQVAPSYSGNYYNAAVYYYKQPFDKIFAIIYGEIYANMESLNPKTLSVKQMVLNTYKDLFAGTTLENSIKDTKNNFAKAVLETYAKQTGFANQTLTPETLAMIRTRFILDWNAGNTKKFPFKLFDYHTQLIKDGLFDSYNQWMFGPVIDQAGFENWVGLHKEDYNRFTEYHTSRIFKMPPGQTYSVQ
ncbi:MAG: tetratricopeptide repeat protein [Niabella sp.]